MDEHESRRLRRTSVFVGALTLAAVVVLVFSCLYLGKQADSTPLWNLLWLCVLLVAAEVRADSLYDGRVQLTLGSIIVMATLIIVGPAGCVIVAVSSLIRVRHAGDNEPLVKRLFNTSQIVLCVVIAGMTYVWLNGPVGSLDPNDFPRVLAPVLGADIVYCVVNAGLLSTVVGLSTGVSPWGFLKGVLLPQAAAYLVYGLLGLLLASLWLGGLGAGSALLLLVPLGIARWVFAQYAGEQVAYRSTIETLVQAVETKDRYTAGHGKRVAHGAGLIGRRTGMAIDRLESLRYSALLHDLGKVGVATRILHKTGGLDQDEFLAIRQHPLDGEKMVGDIAFLEEARGGIKHHHERMDGRGYPDGIHGAQIPEFARIICVADAFDAMTTVRTYRGARSIEEARRELVDGMGKQFDPAVVKAFQTALDDEGWQVDEITPPEPAEPGAAVATVATDHDDPRMSVPPSGSGPGP